MQTVAMFILGLAKWELGEYQVALEGMQKLADNTRADGNEELAEMILAVMAFLKRQQEGARR